MKLLILLALYSSFVSSSIMHLTAEVKDPDLLKQGYACQTDAYGIGLMKQGQEINRFSPTICASATCAGGLITVAGCGALAAGPGLYVVPEDLSKPYPDCCSRIEEENLLNQCVSAVLQSKF